MMARAMLPPPMKVIFMSRSPLASLAEDRGADPHHRRALGDRGLEVVAHAHRQRVEREALRAQIARHARAQRRELARAARAASVGALAMPIRPRRRSPGSAATSRASPSASRGRHAALGRLAADVHLDADVERRRGPRGACRRERAASFARSTPWTQSKCSATSRALLLCSGPMKCQRWRRAARARRSSQWLPARSSRRNRGSRRRRPRECSAAGASWSRRPGVTSRLSPCNASEMRRRTACRLAAIVVIIESTFRGAF